MFHCFSCSWSFIGVYLQQMFHKFHKLVIITLESSSQITPFWYHQLSVLGRFVLLVRVRLEQQHVFGELFLDQPGLTDELVGHAAHDCDDAREQALDGVILEQDLPGVQFGHDAPKTPNVDFVILIAT